MRVVERLPAHDPREQARAVPERRKTEVENDEARRGEDADRIEPDAHAANLAKGAWTCHRRLRAQVSPRPDRSRAYPHIPEPNCGIPLNGWAARTSGRP